MKAPAIVRLTVLLALLLVSRVNAADVPTSKDPYTVAVTTYVDAATDQMKAIRAMVDELSEKATVETVKIQYSEVYRQLRVCDDYVANLRTAAPANFDRLKAEFEKARGKLVKDLELIQRAATG